MKRIADTGLIVALLNRRDPFHRWALDGFMQHGRFFTCDAVLTEAASFFPTPETLLELVARGDVVVDLEFSLRREISEILALAAKYSDRPMDLAGACIVRMTELTRACEVWTVDQADFAVYRRNGRDAIPCVFPAGDG